MDFDRLQLRRCDSSSPVRITKHKGIGYRLRLARRAMGLTYSALGELAGMSHATVQNIEIGRTVPGIDTVERLARALSLDPRWFAYGNPDLSQHAVHYMVAPGCDLIKMGQDLRDLLAGNGGYIDDTYKYLDPTGAGQWCALAATRDEDLVTRLAEIARDEHIAIGVRMTLSPEADIASEPRWGRVMETFGEDPDLVTKMVTAQVVAFQNGRDGLNTGAIVACMKHFPGAGPQMEGKDTSPIISSAETLQIHLKPYYAALEVNIASIMPYYSVPLELDMENSAIGSKATLQDLLRDEMGFEGIIQTDWGMIWAIQEGRGTMMGEEVSDEEAILIGITESRVDGIGGESIRLIDQMEELTNAGKIDEDILTAAATRIVKAKFELGVFENPYCDVEYAVQFVGNEEHQAVNLEAARKASIEIRM